MSFERVGFIDVLAWSSVLATLVVSCGGATSASSTPAATSTTPLLVEVTAGNTNPEPLASTVGAPVTVAWSDIRSSSSCFFFSGPGDLGRDDHLGPFAAITLTPPSAELFFEGGGYRFTGAVSGGILSVGRDAPHEYGGTWMTRETITLSASGSAWVGTYHYDELDPATRVPSSCHIDATVVVTRR